MPPPGPPKKRRKKSSGDWPLSSPLSPLSGFRRRRLLPPRFEACGELVFRPPNSTEILTTAGSSFFAISAKVLWSCSRGGMVRGVASGAATPFSFAALTPVWTTVPIRTPRASVKTIMVEVRNVWFRALSKDLISLVSPVYCALVRPAELLPGSGLLPFYRAWINPHLLQPRRQAMRQQVRAPGSALHERAW